MNQLEVLRESLGQCDEIILDALLMRNRIVEDIMVYKEANDLPVLQPEQEAKQKGWLEAEWKADVIRKRSMMFLQASYRTVKGSSPEIFSIIISS